MHSAPSRALHSALGSSWKGRPGGRWCRTLTTTVHSFCVPDDALFLSPSLLPSAASFSHRMMRRALIPTASLLVRRAAVSCSAVAAAAGSSSALSCPAARSPSCRAFSSSFPSPSSPASQLDPSKSLNYSSKGLRLYVWGNGEDSTLGRLGKNLKGEGSQWSGARPSHTPLLETLWSPKAVESPDGSGFRSLAFGHEHGAFVTGKGDAYTFGAGKWGQLGVGKAMGWVATPRKVEGIPPAVQVAAGQFHTLILCANGSMYSMGRGESWPLMARLMGVNSALGTREASAALAPRLIEVEDNPRFVEIAAGSLHSLARTDQGRVYSFGQGSVGRLGHGRIGGERVPRPLEALQRLTIVQISAGSSFNMVLDSQGGMHSWGRNEKGQLGLGQGLAMDPYAMEPAPQQIAFPEADSGSKSAPSMSRMVCGYKHGLALSDSGKLWVWGQGAQPKPTAFIGEDGWMDSERMVHIGAGDAFSACSDLAGRLWVWGKGAKGCLGQGPGATKHLYSPALVKGFGATPGAAQATTSQQWFGQIEYIMAGHNHCAVLTSGGGGGPL